MKEINLTFGEKIDDLLKSSNETAAAAAKAMDVSPTLLSEIINGKRKQGVTTSVLKKMCEHFEVSADYLLSLSDTKSPDTTVQAICNYTGLSDKAVQYLHLLKELQLVYKPETRSDFLSELLEHKQFDYLLALLSQYVRLSGTRIALEYSTSAEYTACSDILKSHGYVISTPYEQADTLYHERITNILRNILTDISDKQRQEVD